MYLWWRFVKNRLFNNVTVSFNLSSVGLIIQYRQLYTRIAHPNLIGLRINFISGIMIDDGFIISIYYLCLSLMCYIEMDIKFKIQISFLLMI